MDSDLERFKKGKRSKHGRENNCKECYRKKYGKEYLKGGKYYDTVVANVRRWQKKNPEKLKESMRRSRLKRIEFKGKQIYLDENPRTNVCSKCGHKYPDDLKQRTCMHHKIYDDNNPLNHTTELCHSCHTKLHMKTREPLKRDDNGRFIS